MATQSNDASPVKDGPGGRTEVQQVASAADVANAANVARRMSEANSGEPENRRALTRRRLRRGTVMTGEGWTPTGKSGLAKALPRVDVRKEKASKVPPAHIIGFELNLPKKRADVESLVDLFRTVSLRREGITILAQGPFEFSDGGSGVHALVFMRMFPCMETFQHHVFRWHGSRVHHLVATIRAASIDLEPEVLAMLASYNPDPVDAPVHDGLGVAPIEPDTSKEPSSDS